MSDNLQLWNHVFATDPSQTKGFKRQGGFSGTAIKPLYLTQKATALWGPMGDAWGAETVEYLIHRDAVYLKARLWYPGKNGRATIEHWGGDVLMKGEGKPNDEAFKMAFTDAIGKCLVQLGFSADVHLGLFDDSKYVQDVARKETAKSRNARFTELKEGLLASDDPAAYWHEHLTAINEFKTQDKQFYSDLAQAGKARRKQLDDAQQLRESHGEGFSETPTEYLDVE